MIIKTVLSFIAEMISTSQLTPDEVLCGVDVTWQPITGVRSLQTMLRTHLALSEDVPTHELEAHINNLRRRGLIEIQMRPVNTSDGKVRALARQCRLTELGARRRTGIIIA